jgi:hypothetical protein
MARRLNEFPESSGGGTSKYPWGEWTDGSVWEIRRGEDYDIATENMRVNLHMKADALTRKVRTSKIKLDDGEGLVFQFLVAEDKEAVRVAAQEDPGGTSAAIDQLYADLLEIYERARQEVTIPRADGTRQKYAANRFKQQIDRAYAAGELVPAVAKIVRRPTTGFGHLEEARRPDLMVETLVIDAGKPYHRFFSATTVETARQRLADYRERHPDDGIQS